jgi:hypothetical protein
MASQVPYSPEPSISPNLTPTPYGRNVPPPGAFGGLTAAATEHLGQAESQVGNELFERANAMQQLNQTAAADEAASGFQMKSAMQHNELLTKTGKNAADSLIPTLQSIEQSRQDFRQNLNSPYAQMQYDRDTRVMQGKLMDSAGRHAAEQEKAYYHGSLQAKSDTANNVALSLPQDDAAYKQALADKDSIADQMLASQAFPGGKDQRDNWATQQKSALAKNRIEGIARTGDPFTAGRMIDQEIAAKNLVGKDIADVTQMVFIQQNTNGAKIQAGRILSGEGSVAGGGPVPVSIAATTVGQYLSKDNYDLIGRAHDGSGQALGRYGVPAEKLSSMLKDADMPDMSSTDFLKSHSAQDQLFSTTFGKFQDDTGNFNDALKKWIGAEITSMKGTGTAEQRQAFGILKSLGWSDDYAHAGIATISGESGSHLSTMANQQAGGRNWEDRFGTTTPDNGIANWNQARSKAMEQWASDHGMNPNKLETQVRFMDYEAQQMGFNPRETGDPRELTIKLTGSAESGQGYEKPLVNNGGERWARYSGQRYAQDPVIQQVNGLIAKNTPLSDLVEQGQRMAADLAPHNPLFSVYLTDRISGMYRQQEAQQKAEEFQNKQIVDSALMPDQQGKVPTSIEELTQRPEVAQAYDHASPSQQIKWQKTLADNGLQGGVELTPESTKKFITLHAAAINPGATPQERQVLLDEDIPSLSMPMKYKNILFKDQQSVYKSEEASPQMSRALRVLGPIFGDALPDKKDTDNYNSFLSQLHDELAQYNHDFTKPPNDDDIKEMGRRLLLSSPPPYEQRNLPKWMQSETPKQYQLPIDPKYEEIARADPRWEKTGVEPTDDMIRTMWVRQQFQQFYAKQQAKR